MTPDRPAALVRSRRNRVFGGVCAGIADRIAVDPLLVRLLTVLLALFSGGAVALVYVALWALLPEAPPEPPTLEAVPPAAAVEAPAVDVPAVDTPAVDVPAVDTPAVAAGADPRTAWTAVRGELRALAGELRRSRTTGSTATTAPPPATADPRPAPLQAADRAVTAIGERLRAPEVQASARQVATRLSEAVRTSADDLGRRTHRR